MLIWIVERCAAAACLLPSCPSRWMRCFWTEMRSPPSVCPGVEEEPLRSVDWMQLSVCLLSWHDPSSEGQVFFGGSVHTSIGS